MRILLQVRPLLTVIIVCSLLVRTVYADCKVIIDSQPLSPNLHKFGTHYSFQVVSEDPSKILNITINITIDTGRSLGIQGFVINRTGGNVQRRCNRSDSAFCVLNFLHTVPDLLNVNRYTELNQFFVVKSEERDVCALTVITGSAPQKPEFHLSWQQFGAVCLLQIVDLRGFPFPKLKTLKCNDERVSANETRDGFIISNEILAGLYQCSVTVTNGKSSITETIPVKLGNTSNDSSSSMSESTLRTIIVVLATILGIVIVAVCLLVMCMRKRYCTSIINNIINTTPSESSYNEKLASGNLSYVAETSPVTVGKHQPPVTGVSDTASIYSSDSDLVTDGPSISALPNTSQVVICQPPNTSLTGSSASISSPIQETEAKPQPLNENRQSS